MRNPSSHPAELQHLQQFDNAVLHLIVHGFKKILVQKKYLW